jgi:hypothetical protein
MPGLIMLRAVVRVDLVEKVAQRAPDLPGGHVVIGGDACDALAELSRSPSPQSSCSLGPGPAPRWMLSWPWACGPLTGATALTMLDVDVRR